MGEVYRATDTNLGRPVALKTLPDAFALDSDRLARFDREARTLAALNHPNIAAIYGVEKSGGTTALVMELVAGPTLADRISGGAIPVTEALPIARQIAEALEAAHEQGIVHRDLKPANIKLRPDGAVKVLDLGLAKAIEPAVATTAGAVDVADDHVPGGDPGGNHPRHSCFHEPRAGEGESRRQTQRRVGRLVVFCSRC
jgi:serine/threonine protein kinase